MAKNIGLQYTFYFPTTKDKARWKKLSRPYTLNRWIYIMVEKALAAHNKTASTSAHSSDAETVTKLQAQVDQLTTQLRAARSELEAISKEANAPVPLDANVAELLQSGGVWTTMRLKKTLGSWESVAEIADEIKSFDSRSVAHTLNALRELNLVTKTWQGYVWNKPKK